MEPEICYRVGKKIFDTMEEAKQHCQNTHPEIGKNIEIIQKFKAEKIESVKALYQENGLNFESCNCPERRDYSTQCLIHLCTCKLENRFPEKVYDRYICNYHTHLHFKNTGCVYCHHSDCGKWKC